MIENCDIRPPRRGRLSAGAAFLGAALLVAALSVPAPAAAQEEDAAGSVLAASAGGLIGIVAGGYTNLAIVVLKARYGHYPHSFGDAFGLESTPILIGGVTGATIGLLERDLLLPWVLGGAAGLVAGTGVGYLYGQRVWGDPESRWANAAIGAAIGMAVGSTIAIVHGLRSDGDAPGPGTETAVRVPLVRMEF